MSFNIYISHIDSQREEVERLCIHLDGLRGRVGFDIFSRFDIQPGDDVERTIETNLENASIIICLVNADYLNQRTSEIQKIEKFFDIKSKRIIPIILGKCLMDYSFLRRLQSITFTENEETNPETLWYKVAEYLSIYIQDNSQVEPNTSEFTIAPYKAAAGKNMEYGQLKILPTNTIKFKNYQKGDVLFEITGNSMVPYVNDGDYVHTRKCENKRDLTDGRIFVIKTLTEGIMIKKVYDNGNSLILTSINRVNLDFNIEKSTISAMWSIVSVLNINYE